MADVQDLDKERAFIQAGLNLSAETQSHAFCLPVPNTTPQLFVYLGEVDPFAMERELKRLRELLTMPQEGHSHQCRVCLLKYTPAPNASEDCPAGCRTLEAANG